MKIRLFARRGDDVPDDRVVSRVVQMFRALADETRLKILSLLEGGDEYGVTEIAVTLGLTQSNVSHHLSRLMDMGFVSYRREGRFVYYRISDECIKDIMRRARDHVTS